MSQEQSVLSNNEVKEELSLNDIEKALKDDEPIEDANLLADEEKETKKEAKEDKKSENEEPELELSEDEEQEEPDTTLQTPPRKKEILAKYPNIFKDFPYLQAAYYREQQFTELFATPEDAKEVVERAQEFEKFESAVLSGNTESLLKSVKATDEKAFAKIVDDYLPSLARTDQSAYYVVLGNVIKDTISHMVGEAKRLNNEDLQNAALLLNQFVFGNSQFQDPVRMSKQGQEDNSEQEKLNKEREQFIQERFETVRDDLSARVDNILKSTIAQNIDQKGVMTDYVKRTASREVFENLETEIANDSRFKATLDKLWEVSARDNFSKKTVDAIRSAYLGKAKNLLPSILLKARNDALKGLGKRVAKQEKEDEKEERRTTVRTSERTERSNKIPHSVKTLDFLNQD